MYRPNPLKEKLWKERLEQLKDFSRQGNLSEDRLKQVEENFNTENNDSTHALYITDWLRARIALETYDESPEKLAIISSYYTRYKLADYHSVSLDSEFQIDYFDTLLHYAQLAHTQYTFRRYPWKSIAPSELIAELKERESSAEVRLYFKPEYHTPVIQYPNGWAWVIMNPKDKSVEASSLNDCASPENYQQAIILSLREPLEAGYYQTRLRAELYLPTSIKIPHEYHDKPDTVEHNSWAASYPSRFQKAMTPQVISLSTSIIVQLRSYHNHKPGTPIGFDEDGSECHSCKNLKPGDRARIGFSIEEALPYIKSLFSQNWVGWVLRPNYRTDETFLLNDLPDADRKALFKAKPWMFNIRVFERRFGIQNYGDKLKELFLAPPAKLLLQIRKGNLDGVEKRLKAGIKNQRQKIFNAVEELLLRTKNKGTIGKVLKLLSELNQFRQTHLMVWKFLELRIDWLFTHFHYLVRTLSLVCRAPEIHPYRGAILNPRVFRILQQKAVTSADAQTLFKILFETNINSEYYSYSGTKLTGDLARTHRRGKHLLSLLLEQILPQINFEEMAPWVEKRPLPFGNSEERYLLNSWEVTLPLLQQLFTLYSGTDAQAYIASKLIASEADQIRKVASEPGRGTRKRAARRLLDRIYQDVLSENQTARRRSGALLGRISQRRLRRLRR